MLHEVVGGQSAAEADETTKLSSYMMDTKEALTAIEDALWEFDGLLTGPKAGITRDNEKESSLLDLAEENLKKALGAKNYLTSLVKRL